MSKKKILILGAGRSTGTLIKYLLNEAKNHFWEVIVADSRLAFAQKKVADNPNGKAIKLSVLNEAEKDAAIREASVVISMLPAHLHYLVALSCIKHGKSMVTASYLSEDVKALDTEARKKDVLILSEIGVDPGIDHMSAMSVIDRIQENEGIITEFESNTGGLVAPESDNNPWHYKFTWNPRNVVLAGKEGARFLHNSRFKYIPYHKLFERYEVITIPGHGDFEVYPNRDSLKYRETYGLTNIQTMFRGTIRKPGFCDAWNALVQLGLTDDTHLVENSEKITNREFTNTFLAYSKAKNIEEKVARYLNLEMEGDVMGKLQWLGLFTNDVQAWCNATPADLLLRLLQKKWLLLPYEKDMIVMQHQFTYTIGNKKKKTISSMVAYGENDEDTAMSRTVGLPVGIAAKMMMLEMFPLSGTLLPIHRDIYEPVLYELENVHNIKFNEQTSNLSNA